MRTLKEMIAYNQKVRFDFYRDGNFGMKQSAGFASLFQSQILEQQLSSPRTARFSSCGTSFAGRSRTPGQAVLDLSTTSLSLSATRPAAETAGSGGRIQNGIYGQTSGEFNRTDKVVCRPERAVVERCGESRVARFVRTRARAWVSRSRFGDALWSWNTDLIVCWKRS